MKRLLLYPFEWLLSVNCFHLSWVQFFYVSRRYITIINYNGR